MSKSAPASLLSPLNWPAGEYERFMAMQLVDRTSAGEAKGKNGAVTVAYNALAARAGLEALRQGGSAVDAAMTTALAQIALTAGAPISYFGIQSLVYYEAATGKVHSMNAEWNSVRGETKPNTIPGKFGLKSEAMLGHGGPTSGRSALVGGFMKGVESAHQRFGKLPFAALFEPAIHIAEEGMPVNPYLAEQFELRHKDLSRLPSTRAALLKPDGSVYKKGELFRQPAVAETLRRIASEGADYMYSGVWAKKAIAAIQAEGGKMTLEELAAYEVIWKEPLIADLGRGYSLHLPPAPTEGSLNLVEALHLADVAGVVDEGPWWESSQSLKKAVDVSMPFLTYLSPGIVNKLFFPGQDFSPSSRVTRRHAEKLWQRLQRGFLPWRFVKQSPRHSDDVVVVDSHGNMAAITHSINCVYWGRTGINVDGVSIGDAAVHQRTVLAKIKPGGRLPSPCENGILFKDGRPLLAFASMGSGLHVRSLQCLLNVMRFNMSVPQAINAPDFYMPGMAVGLGLRCTIHVPENRFPKSVLDGTGYAWRELPLSEARLCGEGKWVAISRDPDGLLEAGSHNRNNSAALAW